MIFSERVTQLTAAILKALKPGRKSLIATSRLESHEKPSITRPIICSSAIGMRTNNVKKGSK